MRKISKLFGLLLSVSLIGSVASAANVPMKAFQATYDETSTAGGPSVRTYVADGLGHGRSVVIRSSGRKDVSILDIPNHKITILMSDSNTAITMPVRQDDINAMTDFGASFKAGGKSLGTKVIDGHPCHGFHYDLKGASEDLWTGDDIGICVYSKVKSSYGVTESRLKSYSTHVPDPSAFVVPPGYKQAQMPSGI